VEIQVGTRGTGCGGYVDFLICFLVELVCDVDEYILKDSLEFN
jgi:hypothetical protein